MLKEYFNSPQTLNQIIVEAVTEIKNQQRYDDQVQQQLLQLQQLKSYADDLALKQNNNNQ